ncbi:hypothetical protein MMC22_004791 [Lobaria immixta]|nr:hypothetical protein [Lobaria immixta]
MNQSAIALLNSRRRKSRPGSNGTLDLSKAPELVSMPSLNGVPSLKGMPSLTGISDWLQQLGHSDSDLDGLNVIHVAGTKGKGSTCAFVSSFLGAHGKRTGFPRRIGLYTSPHLVRVQERFRINSRPISKDSFAKYVFEVWDGLSLSGQASQAPRYLQLLMLISVHVFIREKVDVAIYETHNGGEYDATNFFPKPVVTGITTIGMDHVEQLGPSLENIAWHKAGIFKHGSPAFSAPQESAVTAVLKRRAVEKEVLLKICDVNPALPAEASALVADVQRINSSLALALVDTFLATKAPKEHSSMTLQDVHRGVEQFIWPGRFQHVIDGNHQWFLDGAHNELSLQQAAQWFAKSAPGMQSNTLPFVRILIFSHLSDRDGASLVQCVAKSFQEVGLRMNHVIFSTYAERQYGTVRNDQCLNPPQLAFSPELQETYVKAWKSIDPDVGGISIESTIEGTLNLARKLGDQDSNGMQTLITGSLYLVGGALSFLQPNPPDLAEE